VLLELESEYAAKFKKGFFKPHFNIFPLDQDGYTFLDLAGRRDNKQSANLILDFFMENFKNLIGSVF
jgi:hypothetical protein